MFEPPEGYRPANRKKGTAWCPCCGEERQFGWDARLGYARCTVCRISERDFYVRKFNSLWSDGELEKFVRGAVKSYAAYEKPFLWEVKEEEDSAAESNPCEKCGSLFEPASNRQKYCRDCGNQTRREQRKQSVYRTRANQYFLKGVERHAQNVQA